MHKNHEAYPLIPGGVGKECVLRLCEKNPEEVKEIRAVIRNPSQIVPGFFPADSRLKVIAGDVTKEQSLDEVLCGANYAIFAAAGGRSNNIEVAHPRAISTSSYSRPSASARRSPVRSSTLRMKLRTARAPTPKLERRRRFPPNTG